MNIENNNTMDNNTQKKKHSFPKEVNQPANHIVKEEKRIHIQYWESNNTMGK
jgi:hypothetical protein